MKRLKAFIVCLLLTVSLPSLTWLERVRAKITASQPFRADFVQQVMIDGEMNLEESGFIVFAGPGRVKWQYLSPDFKTFILENGRYQFYDRENNQLLKGRIDPGREQLIWDLLCSPKPGQSSRWDERTRTVLLRVDDGSGPQQLKIRIAADLLPERVEQTTASDVTNVYLFRNFRTGIALADSDFALAAPVDVEIIESE